MQSEFEVESEANRERLGLLSLNNGLEVEASDESSGHSAVVLVLQQSIDPTVLINLELAASCVVELVGNAESRLNLLCVPVVSEDRANSLG